MLVGVSPFYHANERTMLQRIVHEDVQFPPDFPRDAISLVKGNVLYIDDQRLIRSIYIYIYIVSWRKYI